jgi:hypothetical protein
MGQNGEIRDAWFGIVMHPGFVEMSVLAERVVAIWGWQVTDIRMAIQAIGCFGLGVTCLDVCFMVGRLGFVNLVGVCDVLCGIQGSLQVLGIF